MIKIYYFLLNLIKKWRLNHPKILIGKNFVYGKFFRCEPITHYLDVTYTPKIIFGNNVHIEDFVHIGCTNKIQIGENTVIASKVYITDHNHGYYDEKHFSEHENPKEISPLNRKLTNDSEVIIGKNVWIGENVTILPDTKIGDGAVVAANSIIKGTVAPFTIVTGMPLKIIKKYSFSNNRWESINQYD
jgi:lipopolysaccharide O-acetyltransferase